MPNNIKSYFPIFKKHPELVYLDNAATTQRPASVIKTIHDFDSYENASIHRGIYDLSNAATKRYEDTRRKVGKFLGLADPQTIAFTKGTTESINIVAHSFFRKRISTGDNIVTTLMEHHANFLPWRQVADESGAELRIASLDENGDLQLKQLFGLIDERTRLVAVTHISNTLGTINDLEEIIDHAHKKGVPVLVDAAQSASLHNLNAEKFQYDFLAFSAHKIFGPFGTGVLYVAPAYRSEIGPYNLGGGMVEEVSVEGASYLPYPHNLEAGTPNVSGVLGLSAALDFLSGLDRPALKKKIDDLTAYCKEQLVSIPEIQLIGNPGHQSGIISFVVRDIHAHDVASFLNKDQVAVRAGMHCTQPLLKSLSIPATVRISFSIYNEQDEVDRVKRSLIELIKFWK